MIPQSYTRDAIMSTHRRKMMRRDSQPAYRQAKQRHRGMEMRSPPSRAENQLPRYLTSFAGREDTSWRSPVS